MPGSTLKPLASEWGGGKGALQWLLGSVGAWEVEEQEDGREPEGKTAGGTEWG